MKKSIKCSISFGKPIFWALWILNAALFPCSLLQGGFHVIRDDNRLDSQLQATGQHSSPLPTKPPNRYPDNTDSEWSWYLKVNTLAVSLLPSSSGPGCCREAADSQSWKGACLKSHAVTAWTPPHVSLFVCARLGSARPHGNHPGHSTGMRTSTGEVSCLCVSSRSKCWLSLFVERWVLVVLHSLTDPS